MRRATFPVPADPAARRPAPPFAVLLVAALMAPPLGDGAAARPRRHHAHGRSQARSQERSQDRFQERSEVAAGLPSPDAVGLGTLAPPTRLSTLEQDYGDAAYARARARRRDDALVGRRSEEAASAAVLFPCDPRSAGAAAYRCGPAPGLPGYGLAYAYNPAYVTSPFSSGHDPREQAPVLPGVTGLFYAVNGLVAGHGD